MKLLPLLLLLAIPVSAQTATRTLTWAQTDATPTQIGTYVYSLKAGTAAPVTVVPTCVARAAGGVTCSLPLTALASTYTLTVDNGFGSASATVSGTGPAQPSGLTITVTISLQ